MTSRRRRSPLFLLGLTAVLGCALPETRSVDRGDGGGAHAPAGIGDLAVAAPDGGTTAIADAPGAAGRGVCLAGAGKRLGAACGCARECDSGNCADGVCCNLPCDGPCLRCDSPDRVGACTPVAIGAPDPRGICTPEAPESCGRNGLCAGSGCAKYPPGTNCRPATCAGSSLIYPYCSPDGTCGDGSPINCAPSICAAGACKLTCASDADCAPGRPCVNGSCGQRGPGQACDDRDQCQSGFCVDGVCCDGACAGRCSSCALPGARGRCTPVPADTPDPRAAAGIKAPGAVCLDEGAKNCGSNGRCDGSGGCQRYPTGTVCKAESCDPATNRWTPDAVCSAGACGVGLTRACAPFRCDPSGRRCASNCTRNEDCDRTTACVNGSCGKKATGNLCTRDTDCATGRCAQGVCCTTACAGRCHACNLPKTLGICAALPEGAIDPTGTCKNQGASTCGTDGTCDGSGGCRKFGPDIACAPQSCARGNKVTASLCNGAGACVAGTSIACLPYQCNAAGTDCFNSCRGTGAATECQAPNLCNNQRCGSARKGQACGATADCATGLTCADGVCCATACGGPCKTCKRTPGTCTDLPAGTRSGGCAVDPVEACGNTGSCDGRGGCAQAAATVTCAPAACTSERAGKGEALCDGNGACLAPAALQCGNNRCAAGVCAPCAKDTDCLDGKACDVASGTCGPLGVNGAACASGDQCASGACVDDHCCESPQCGTCQRCGGDGKCRPVTGMPDPDSCPDERAALPCGRAGCDGSGACPFADANQVVAGPTCASATAASVTTCDGQGGTRITDTTCREGFRCIGGACPVTCSSDAACLPPRTCVDGTCARKPLGAACTDGERCETGFCAGGVCCDKKCDGPCETCSADGICAPSSCEPDAGTGTDGP